jgi:hypothetical protein
MHATIRERRRARIGQGAIAPGSSRALAIAVASLLCASSAEAAEASAEAAPPSPRFALSQSELHVAPLRDPLDRFQLSAGLSATSGKALAGSTLTLQGKLSSATAACTVTDALFADSYEQ